MSEKYNLLSYFLKELSKTAIRAGKEIISYQQKISEYNLKNDNSPVTCADILAEEIILNDLQKLDKKIPIVAEENSYKNGFPVFNGDSFWCIDALDGTKEFLNLGRNFTVNICLILDGVPTLGIIYLPIFDKLYTGIYLNNKRENIANLMDGKKRNKKIIKTRKKPKTGLIVLDSLHHSKPKLMDKFLTQYNIKEIIPISSSIKFCLIAEGKADIYPKFGPTSEWDTAAGHAILNAAGGQVRTFDGDNLVYNKKCKKYVNDNFIASGMEF